MIVRRSLGFIGQVARRLAGTIAATIRVGGETVPIAMSVGGTRQGESVSPGIAGAMIVGAGRRIGEEANGGATTEASGDEAARE